jgi:membrane protease YdiL (CAAX protease family)
LNVTPVIAARHPQATSYGVAIAIALVLVVSRFSYSLLLGRYVAHLMRINQFALSHFYLDYSDLGLSIIIFIELLFVCLILHPRTSPHESDTLRVRNKLVSTNILIAALGISLSVVAVPLTPILLQPFMLADLIVDNLLFSPKLLIPATLVIVLPLVGEIVFLRVILSAWCAKMGIVPAILAASLVFALSWPLTAAPSAFCIGLMSGVLFVRSKSIFPAVLANFLATLSCIAMLVWQAIARGRMG